jgi:voltage-gated potassium channel Kch
MGPDQFGAVLLLIMSSIVLTALAGDVGIASRLAWMTLLGASLLYALHTSGATPWVMVVAAALVVGALPASFGVWLLNGEPVARAIGYGLAAVVVSMAVLVIARRLVRHPVVNAATIAGAVCVYLLIGDFFAMTFGFISWMESRHFFTSTSDPIALDYVYFSYSTLATLGYGDLVARSALGRMLAILEALMGQIYLVTIVALIVGSIGRPRHRRPGRDGDGSSDPPPPADDPMRP